MTATEELTMDDKKMMDDEVINIFCNMNIKYPSCDSHETYLGAIDQGIMIGIAEGIRVNKGPELIELRSKYKILERQFDLLVRGMNDE